MASPLSAKQLAHQAKVIAGKVRKIVVDHPQPHHAGPVRPSPQGSGIHRAGPEPRPQ